MEIATQCDVHQSQPWTPGKPQQPKNSWLDTWPAAAAAHGPVKQAVVSGDKRKHWFVLLYASLQIEMDITSPAGFKYQLSTEFEGSADSHRAVFHASISNFCHDSLSLRLLSKMGQIISDRDWQLQRLCK